MKLNPDEIKSVKDEYSKPDLGEVVTSSPSEEPVEVAQRAEQASAAPSTAIAESVEASGSETADVLSSMMEQNSQLNAKLLVALDDINRGNFAIQESLDRMFRFMWDERYAPKPTIRERDPFVPDSKSKEDRPGNGEKGEGALDGMLGGLLGAAGAALAGKSILGSVFGRNRGAPTTTQPRSRIGGWIDRVRGKATTPNTPNTPNSPNAAPRAASTTASPATAPNRTPTPASTPTSPSNSTGRTMPKGGRMALIAGVGTAAYMGYDWVSSKISESNQRMDENRFITLEERTMQSNRVNAGLPMLEGQDLINYRTEVYGKNNILVNPKTGFPLSQAQTDAVRGGATLEYASSLTNDQAYELVSSGQVTATPAESSIIPSYAGELAVTGVGLYAAKKVGDMLSPTTVAPSTAPNAVVPGTAPTSVSRTAPPMLSRPPMADNVRRQALPSDAQLKAIRSNITSTASSVTDAVETSPRMKMGKALPVIGTALTVYDAANVITDDTKTTGEKAGELTDIAGGTAGAILGAKAGAGAGAAVGAAIGAFFFGAGAVPGAAIGAAIGGIGGGIAGYMGGSSITKSAREWMFGDDEPEVSQAPTPVVASSTTTASTGDPTEEAFNQIVNASKPINNSWVSSVSTNAPTNTVGVGVLRPGVANPNVSNPKTTASTANVASSAGVFAQAASATPSASVSSVTANPVPVVREAYQPVKETYVVNNMEKESSTTVAATASKERVANKGMGSTNTAVTRIDEISPVINDGGLGLLNAGVL